MQCNRWNKLSFKLARRRKNSYCRKEKCKNIIREFNSYIWDEKAQEKGENKPVKQNDHALDALRYFYYKTLFPNKKRGAYFGEDRRE